VIVNKDNKDPYKNYSYKNRKNENNYPCIISQNMTWIDIGFAHNFLEPCAYLHIPIDIQDKRHGQGHDGEYKDNNRVKKPLCSSNNVFHGSTTAFLRGFVYKQPE
jgi:hypothetical protein